MQYGIILPGINIATYFNIEMDIMTLDLHICKIFLVPE